MPSQGADTQHVPAVHRGARAAPLVAHEDPVQALLQESVLLLIGLLCQEKVNEKTTFAAHHDKGGV